MADADQRRSLWAAVAWRAERSPDHEALVDETGRRVTFAGFRDRAERVAAALAEHGVRAGTPVTWQLPTWVEALVLTAALARLGAVQAPVLPVHGERQLRFVVGQTGARLVVVTPERGGADLAGADVLVVDRALPEAHPSSLPPPPPVPASSADAPVRWVFYTSGTTADPKGAQHTDPSVLSAAHALGTALGCTPDDRVGMTFPVAHIGGCTTWLGASLLFGCTLVLDATFDAERTVELLRRERATLPGPGTAFTLLYLQAQRRRPGERLFPHLRTMTSGAAPKPPTLHRDVKRELGGAGVMSSWGLTEAPILTMTRLDDPDDVLAATEGRANDGVDIRVVGPDGRALPPGQEGELRVKGPQVMRGYVDHALDADAFDADGYLRTGDLGRLDEQGNVVITGRLKDVIIRKGENISAREVEDELRAHPAVADVAVVGLPDPRSGELACAVVVPAGDAPTLDTLTGFLRERGLAPYKLPERLEVVVELPRNATGKVSKPELRARLQQG